MNTEEQIQEDSNDVVSKKSLTFNLREHKNGIIKIDVSSEGNLNYFEVVGILELYKKNFMKEFWDSTNSAPPFKTQ